MNNASAIRVILEGHIRNAIMDAVGELPDLRVYVTAPWPEPDTGADYEDLGVITTGFKFKVDGSGYGQVFRYFEADYHDRYFLSTVRDDFMHAAVASRRASGV